VARWKAVRVFAPERVEESVGEVKTPDSQEKCERCGGGIGWAVFAIDEERPPERDQRCIDAEKRWQEKKALKSGIDGFRGEKDVSRQGVLPYINFRPN